MSYVKMFDRPGAVCYCPECGHKMKGIKNEEE